jgi:branched-subunit amino acid aminotransferase/4-amino-4-deoxychorismate lyase
MPLRQHGAVLTIEINGRPAEGVDVHHAVMANYGHYTSMQVRDGAVRGLDLHLARLDQASSQLFGQAVDHDRIRAFVRHALDGVPAASVRVTVVQRPRDPLSTDVLVSVSDPVDDTPGPALRVRSTEYEREVAHLKHVATMGVTYHWRQAVVAGFDDVLFVGRDGLVREGSVWNIAFWDGEQVVWPAADVLPGVTMQLLQRAGVPWTSRELTVADLPGLGAAVATNSHCPSQPLASIDEVGFPADGGALAEVLNAAWAEVRWDAV